MLPLKPAMIYLLKIEENVTSLTTDGDSVSYILDTAGNLYHSPHELHKKRARPENFTVNIRFTFSCGLFSLAQLLKMYKFALQYHENIFPHPCPKAILPLNIVPKLEFKKK